MTLQSTGKIKYRTELTIETKREKRAKLVRIMRTEIDLATNLFVFLKNYCEKKFPN